MVEFKIGWKKVGDDNLCFLIAEIGVNHDGDLFQAVDMIDELVKIGVDAIKFQTYITEELVLKSEKSFNILKQCELDIHSFIYLAQYVSANDMVFLTTPFDVRSAKAVEEFVPAYKISSGDINNFNLLKFVALTKKPIIISTGTAIIKEVRMAVDFLKENGTKDIVILQCTTQYPVPDDDVYLNVIDLYKKEFPDCVIGFSDHSSGHTASIGAVAKGAKVIERHFTFDKNMKGPDHRASLDPKGMRNWVRLVRIVEKQLGVASKFPSLYELSIRAEVRKSIVSVIDIKKGEIFSESNITTKRPGFGLSAGHYYKVVGKVAKRNVPSGSVLWWNDVVMYNGDK